MVPEARPRYAGYVAWRGTIDCAELSRRTAGVLLDAFTYRIFSGGHVLTYPIPGPDGADHHQVHHDLQLLGLL
jgi:2,6-dihydroxypyridine 3-monooxygenase